MTPSYGRELLEEIDKIIDELVQIEDLHSDTQAQTMRIRAYLITLVTLISAEVYK